MKKLIFGILFFWFVLNSHMVLADSTGTCGANVAYTISGNTISFSKVNSGSAAVWADNCRTAFKNNSEITIVNMTDTIRGIDTVEDENSETIGMFSDCHYVEEMYLSNLDVSDVTDMDLMFGGCWSIKKLDVSGWDTSNVTNMSLMFAYCDMTSLDLSRWDTSKVLSMSEMFIYCQSMTSLDLSGWDTSSVKDMSMMFFGCNSLKSLNLSGWDTSGLPVSIGMFSDCNSLRSLKLGKKTIEKNIFDSLPAYNEPWYYIVQSPDAAQPLKLGTAKSNGDLFNSYTYNTMAGTWVTEDLENNNVNPLSEKQYLIIVVDENGNRISGANVTWTDQIGTKTVTSDAMGRVYFGAISNREPVITVEKTNYITWTNNDMYWQKNDSGVEKVILYPKSTGNLKLSSARYSNFSNMSMNTNLLTDTKKVSLGNDAEHIGDLDYGNFYLSCKVMDETAVSRYEIWQGEKFIAQSTSGFFELNSENFSKGANCFVRVYGTNGSTRADTAINLVFAKAPRKIANQISFDGKKISIAVADSVPYVGGSNLDIDLKKVNIPVTAIISENKVRIGFNINLDEGKDQAEQLKEVKQFTEEMKRLTGWTDKKGIKHNGLNVGKLNIGQRNKYESLIKNKNKVSFIEKAPELNFIGYGEGDWSSDKITCNFVVMMELEAANIEYNTWVAVFPVTLQIKLSVEGSFGTEISYNHNTNTFDGNISLNFEPKLSAFFGMGVSKLVGVGAYGSAKIELEIELLPVFETDKVDLTGDLGIKAYLGNYTYQRPFAYNTWHLYTRTKPKEFVSSDEYFEGISAKGFPDEEIVSSVSQGLYDASQYHKADFGYLREEADHMGSDEQKGLSSKDSSGNSMVFESLIENTYRNAQPVMVANNDAFYAAFLRADTSGRVYAVVSKNAGNRWEEPVELNSTDQLADAPTLFADSNNFIWLAYAKTGSFYYNPTLSNWANSQVLIVGGINPDTLGLTNSKVYNDMGYVHMQTFAIVDGVPTMVWISSQVENDNDVLWPVHNTIYKASYTSVPGWTVGWSNPEVVGTVDHVITELAAGEVNGDLSIGYIMDSDNDHATTDDHMLVMLTGNNQQTLSNSASALTFDVLPGSDSPGFIWFEAGTLHSSNGAEADLNLLTNEYRIEGDSIYYSAANETGSGFGVFRYENEKWSQPIQLTEGEGYLENISVARFNGADYVLGMYTAAAIGEEEIEDNKNLVWSMVSDVSDIVIDNVEYDEETLSSGQEVSVTLTVRNAGDHTVTGLDIQIDDQANSVQNVNLGLGESTQINLIFTIPSEMHTFKVQVTETGKTDYHLEDNEAIVVLGCPDLTVTLEWNQVGKNTQIVAAVQNIGKSPAAGRLSFVDYNGNDLEDVYISETAPGEKMIVYYDLDWNQIKEPQIDVLAVVESFTEERILYNNDDSLHLVNYGHERIEKIDITLPPKLTTIGNEAFAGGTFTTVVIPEGVTSIGERAFADCKNLKQIDIPVSVTNIADNAFEGTKGLVVYCPMGSEAETFAENNGIISFTN